MPRGLLLRLASGLVLAPLVVATVYAGSPFMETLIVVCVSVMGWEWSRMCGGEGWQWPGLATIAAVVLAVVMAGQGHFAAGFALLASGFLASLLAATLGRVGEPLWHSLGPLYIGFPALSFMWLLHGSEGGPSLGVWLLILVWSVDTAAYVFGTLIGGPKLAPRISPKKTWAGALSGLAVGTLAAGGTSIVLGLGSPLAMTGLGAGLAVAVQLGDLFESLVKRRFARKDTSRLIPGHGGILDRVDGLIAGTLALALFMQLDAGLL